MHAKTTITLIAAATLVAGCSSADPEVDPGPPSDPPTESAAPTPSEASESPTEAALSPTEQAAPDVDAVELGLQLVTAINGQTIEEQEAALGVVEPDSPAEAYSTVQVSYARAVRADGLPMPEDSTTRSADSVVSTPSDGSDPIEFSDFEVGDSGLLTRFTVSGEDITPLVSSRQDPSDIGSGATVTMLGAYRSVEYGGLIVTLEIQAGDGQLDPSTYSAEYVTPEGEQRAAETAFGPTEIRAGARSYAAIAIPEATLGGTFYLGGTHGSDYNQEWELQAELPASFAG